ncbi:MAG: ABC transporter substrate-binding protein [Erysipelotrichaceae bacterium]|nr:ABC transporter substrate-binding protein [Erysipelotrichaceae bacterium]
MKKLLVVLLALLMLVGCGNTGTDTPDTPATDDTGKTEVDTFSMIESFDISTLDYVYNNKSSNGDYTSNFIEGLLTQDPHGKLVGGMAKEWSANEDASEWTFVIRDDATWSTASGEVYDNVKAEDFITGMQHAVASKSETLGLVIDLIQGLRAYSEGTGSWDDVGIKADGNTLTYTLTGPCGYFDGLTTYSILWPVNGEFLESQGSNFGAVDANSILYNGCYILSSLVPAQEVRFDANPNYYDKENVHVQHVVVTYTNGEDPTQGWKMFVNGETSSASINSSYPEVVEEANEKYAENQYKTDTTATSYWGAFNFDRQLYNLYNDPSVSTTVKDDAQKADAKAAILNKYFRLAVYAAYSTKATQAISKGEERALDAARNTLVPYTFAVTSDGRSYGDILTEKLVAIEPEFADINLNDGQDAWYNPERAKKFAEMAKEELGDAVSSWPVILDYPVYAASENNKNAALAMEKSIEDAIGEYVDVNLVMLEGDSSVYYSAFYDITTGSENSIDFSFGAGWGPDYGDPLTYLHCYDALEGDMLQYSGLDLAGDVETESGKAAKEAIGLYDVKTIIDEAATKTGDERIEAFAEAEATLLANGIFRSYSTSGASLQVSCVKPYSAAYGLYGQAAYNAVPYFKYMVVYDKPVTAAEHDEAKAAWLKGE